MPSPRDIVEVETIRPGGKVEITPMPRKDAALFVKRVKARASNLVEVCVSHHGNLSRARVRPDSYESARVVRTLVHATKGVGGR